MTFVGDGSVARAGHPQRWSSRRDGADALGHAAPTRPPCTTHVTIHFVRRCPRSRNIAQHIIQRDLGGIIDRS
jgi:hypothetical protein